MRFNVAGFTYTLALVEEIGGDPDLLGRIDRSARLIQISAECPADRRLEVFLHELTHAWLFHTPKPGNDEELCDVVATITASLWRDLGRQGGVLALLAMGTGVVAPAQLPGATAYHGTLSPIEGRSLRCEKCTQSITAGSVVQQREERHPRLGCPFVRLSFYCESCGHVVTWTEVASLSGGPSGVEIDHAEYITGAACADFCRRHPQETGTVFYDDAA
jgi:hypothetical protein